MWSEDDNEDDDDDDDDKDDGVKDDNNENEEEVGYLFMSSEQKFAFITEFQCRSLWLEPELKKYEVLAQQAPGEL